MLKRLAALTAAAALQGSGLLFAQFNETIPLPQSLLAHSAVLVNNLVYVAGGIGDAGGVMGKGGYLNNVYYCATINPDGTLGAWRVASNMPEFLGLGLHASVAYNGRLYVLGGTNMFGPRDVVYYSSINPDGSLTAWNRTTPMPLRLAAHAVALNGSRIYVLGGIVRSEGATDAVYYTDILPDGAFGEWKRTVSLPARLFGHKASVSGGKLFVIGGTTDTTFYVNGQPSPNLSDKVYAADLNADGALGQWSAVSSLPGGISLHAVASTARNIYILGGYNGTGISNAVYFAPLASGAPGAWQTLDALPKGLIALASVASEEYLYALGGGLTYIDEPQSNIYFARIRAELRAFVRIFPATLNKKSKGRWITAIVGLPEADVRGINPVTVRISAVNGKPVAPIYADPAKFKKRLIHENEYSDRDEDDDAEGDEAGDRKFRSNLSGHKFAVFKFSRQAVQGVVPEGSVTIKLEGALADARVFSGESANWIIKPGRAEVNVAMERAGFRRTPSGAGVDIPRGAFPGNPDLLLTVENEDKAALRAVEKEKRLEARKKRGLAEVSDPVEFGPPGLRFERPLTLALPYDPARLPAGAEEDSLKVCYWNAEAGDWEVLPSTVSKGEKLVRADVTHFSVYQVMAGAAPSDVPAPAEEFILGEVYVFPNPAKGGEKPKLHLEVSSGDRASVKVYTASGRLAAEVSVSGAPAQVTDSNGPSRAYELEVRRDLPSGVYYYRAEASKGAQKLTKSGKFAVVR